MRASPYLWPPIWPSTLDGPTEPAWIIEQPTINLLNVQVWNDDTEAWDDWSGMVNYIDVVRGGEVTVDVGTMNIVLISEDDPIADESLTPNTLMRVVIADTTTPIFTGTILDAHLEVIYDGMQLINRITLQVVDAVYEHNSTTRYGAVSDSGGHETWVERITRLALSSRTAVTLPTEPETPYLFELQDVAYVSSLANHFRLACQTVGAGWFVGTDNVTRFRAPDDDSAPVATFADVFSASFLQYQSVSVSRSTSDVANVLKITNHGRGNDGNTFDVATTFEDAPSIADWGARVAATDMSLWDADTYLSGRATEIFTALADPVRSVTSFTWNAQQQPSTAALLEIQSRVNVRFRGETFTTRIAWIRHEITPGSWMITVGLNPRGIPDASAATLTAGSAAAAGALPTTPDARKPLPPAGLEASPFAAWQGGSIVLAIAAEWDAVTVGDNGAPITVAFYEVWARPDDGSTPARSFGTTTGLSFSATDPAFASGDTWLVKVRAASVDGVWSDFTDEESIILGEPAEELTAPTDPIVSTRPGLGIVAWDGQLSTGPAPASLRDVLVQTALAEDADDEEWSPVRYVFGPGDAAMVASPSGSTYWVRFVAFDRLGRASSPSAAVAVTVPPIPGGEIDMPSLRVSLIEAGLSGDIILEANGSFEVLAGQVAETRSVFRVTSEGAEVRQEGVGSYLALLAEAVRLYGPAGTVGAELTAFGLEAPVVIVDEIRQQDFIWTVSSDGQHLTLR